MPVYSLPLPLESSLNTLLSQQQPHSWRVNSQDDEITVVIRWPQVELSSCDKVVCCKSANDDSSAEEEQTSKHRRHMWSRHSKAHHRSKKEIESERKKADLFDTPTKFKPDFHRRKWEPYPSPRTLPSSSPFPAYLTTSGQDAQTISSHAFTTEKVRNLHHQHHQHQAILPPKSDDVLTKTKRHLKDIGRSDSSPGLLSRASSSISSSPSSSSSSTYDHRTSKSGSSNNSSSSRHRMKSEPSPSPSPSRSLAGTKGDSTEKVEARNARNAESFYRVVARALKGYGQQHEHGSEAGSPFRLGSPGQTLTSGGEEARTPNRKSPGKDDLLISDVDMIRKCQVNICSLQDSLNWDSLDSCSAVEASKSCC